MRYPRHLKLAVGIAVLVVQSACSSSPDPNLYTIAPASGAAHASAPKVIALHQIGVARYLERSQIVRSSENYRLDVLANDWWGEPIGALLARVLADELNQRLPGSTVYADTGAVSVSPDATIELNVTRMDLNGAGVLVLQAQAAVAKGRATPLTQSFHFEVPPPNGTVAGEVAAISTAIGQLADGLATMLASGRTAR
jgi:uncharacterized lipoprotein YmbA